MDAGAAKRSRNAFAFTMGSLMLAGLGVYHGAPWYFMVVVPAVIGLLLTSWLIYRN